MTPIFTLIDRFPPILCRLLAQENGYPMTMDGIARVCGTSKAHVVLMSHQTTWDDIDIRMVRKFSLACGIDFNDQTSMWRSGAMRYLHRRPRWTHLRRSSLWESYYRPLLNKWLDSTRTHPEWQTFYKPMMAKWRK